MPPCVRFTSSDPFTTPPCVRLTSPDPVHNGPVFRVAGKCRDPEKVSHAHHDGPAGVRVFPLGTQLTYSCSDGYISEGFSKAMCVGEGHWVGPRMTCTREDRLLSV